MGSLSIVLRVPLISFVLFNSDHIGKTKTIIQAKLWDRGSASRHLPR
jgi:hypothetical protein